MKSVVRYRVTEHDLTPEKKKQAESEVRYREAGREPAPEKKKQAKSAVRYRVTEHEPAPEKKKQAKSAIIWDAFMEHWDELTDFTFYQAEYDEERQKVKIRKKAMWKLK